MNNIHRILKHVMLAATMSIASQQALAADVGVSVTIGQPGFYGRIDIGDYPYPQPYLIYPQPIIIHRHYDEEYEPIYLRVPPGHARQWHRYCERYHACDRPVYFVQDRWYNEIYVPQYRERYGHENERRGDDDHERGYDRERGHGRDQGDNENRHGRGHGKGHDRD